MHIIDNIYVYRRLWSNTFFGNIFKHIVYWLRTTNLFDVYSKFLRNTKSHAVQNSLVFLFFFLFELLQLFYIERICSIVSIHLNTNVFWMESSRAELAILYSKLCVRVGRAQVKPLVWVESVIERHEHSRIEFMVKVCCVLFVCVH